VKKVIIQDMKSFMEIGEEQLDLGMRHEPIDDVQGQFVCSMINVGTAE
jgi:hypothetical protein